MKNKKNRLISLLIILTFYLNINLITTTQGIDNVSENLIQNNMTEDFSDECSRSGSIWTRNFGTQGKWGSYGITPSDPVVNDLNKKDELFCSEKKEDRNYWSHKMWHNGAVKLKLECENDPDEISGCGILCEENGNIIPEIIVVEKNGEYKLCTSDKAGNAVVKKVYVNWIDWGGDKNGPSSGRPNIIKQNGEKLLCLLDDGSVYDGHWLNANDGDVVCKLLVQDNAGSGKNTPKILSVVPVERDDYLSNWYSEESPGLSGVKRVEFIGKVFESLSKTKLDIDLLTPELVKEGFEFIFAEDIEKVADSKNMASLRVTDYAGNHNDVNDQDLSDWEIRIDKTPPTVSHELKCFSNRRLYLGNEAIDDKYFPNGWTSSEVDCGYCLIDEKVNNSSSKLESWQSKTTARKNGVFENWEVYEVNKKESDEICESFIYKREQNQIYDLDGEMMDIAGNDIEFEEKFIIKIDKKPLEFDENIRMKNSEDFRLLSEDMKSPTKFEAHEEFQLSLGIKEPEDEEAPIDWVNSWISIKHSRNNGAVMKVDDIEKLSFANISKTGISFNEYTQKIIFSDEFDVFEKSGDYELTFYIIDQAGNEQSPPTTKRYVEIVSSEIAYGEEYSSEFNDITEKENIYANNLDEREFEIVLRDRFGNIIYKRDIEVTIVDQDISKNIYDLTQQGGVNGLAEGLSFNKTNISSGRITDDGKKQIWSYNTGNIAVDTFSIKSYLPSVKVIYGQDGASLLIEETDNLGNIIGQTAEFEFVAPSINSDGEENTIIKDIVDFKKSLYFKPIVYGYMVDQKESDGDSVNFITVLSRIQKAKDPANEIELTYGQKFPFFVYTNTGGSGGNLLSKKLPMSYGVEVMAHALSGISFAKVNYGKDVDVAERTVGFCPEGTYCQSQEGSELTQTHPLRTGAAKAPKFAFSSKINTKIQGKNVIYPGGNLGNDLGDGQSLFDLDCATESCPAWFNDAQITIISVEADIEGDILGEASYTEGSPGGGVGKSNIITMGGVSAQDIREDIVRNAYELTRGIVSQKTNYFDLESGYTFNKYDNILYIKGSGQNTPNNLVKLGGEFTGIGTIIIEDANILIDKNMSYGDSESSLGIILINTKTFQAKYPYKEGPETGNIYITPEVKHIIGTYFAEGSLLTAIYSGEGTLPDPDHNNISTLEKRSQNLIYQLIIEGTILTKNTLGGVVDEKTGIGQNKTPWGSVENNEDGLQAAMKYDLHWLRRYSPQKSIDTDGHFTCAFNQSGICDLNKHATVIRPDGKVKNLTPPGFNIGTLIRR